MRYIQQNLREFEFSNILKWHEKGYLGQGVKFMELESANPNDWIFDGMLTNDFDDPKKWDRYTNGHGNKVFDVVHQIAPKTELYVGKNGGQYGDTIAKGLLVDKTIPYIIEKGIHIVGASLGGTDSQALNKIIQNVKDTYGVSFFTSAGNSSYKGLGGYALSDVFDSIAAVGIRNSYDIYRKHYSSISTKGKQLDCTNFSGIYVYNAEDKSGKSVMPMEGTSFSQPYHSGMCCLVQSFFLEKIGRTLWHDELRAFYMDFLIDLGEIGWDKYYGYGIFVLPDPEEIDIEKYILRGGNLVNHPDKIILHHSATHEGTFESIKRYHIERKGFFDIGYHYLIENDGTLRKGRDEKMEGAHTLGENQRSIGICLVGNFDHYKPNDKQMDTLYNLLTDIFNRYGKLPIYGHNHFADKTCPGTQFPMKEVLAKMYSSGDKNTQQVSEWAKDAQKWVKEQGISDGTRPKDSVTREEVWTMLYRIFNQK